VGFLGHGALSSGRWLRQARPAISRLFHSFGFTPKARHFSEPHQNRLRLAARTPPVKEKSRAYGKIRKVHDSGISNKRLFSNPTAQLTDST
jgi:hypothetical protein